jgi:hypothetical protein
LNRHQRNKSKHEIVAIKHLNNHDQHLGNPLKKKNERRHRLQPVDPAMEEVLWQVAPDAGVVASASFMGGSFTKVLLSLGAHGSWWNQQ